MIKEVILLKTSGCFSYLGASERHFFLLKLVTHEQKRIQSVQQLCSEQSRTCSCKRSTLRSFPAPTQSPESCIKRSDTFFK